MGIFTIFASGESAGVILVGLGAWLISIVIAIVSHEFAHSFAACKMGDMTPKYAGRLTLNPIAHLDWIGFLCLMVFGFGWAKGVPVNPNNFRNYRRGQVAVSLSGVLTNLVLGIVFTFFSVLTFFLDGSVLFFLFLQYLMMYGAIINFMLALFNILPIYPLDGFNFIEAFCKYDNKFIVFMRKYGIFFLLGVMLFAGYISMGCTWLYWQLYALFGMMF